MSGLELHYCSICGWEEKSYELPPRSCPNCGFYVQVGEPALSVLDSEEKPPEPPKAVAEADALLIIRSITSAHEVFRKVLLERDLLEDEVKRLRVYKEQCNGLAKKFCTLLTADAVPKAIEYIEQLKQVAQSMRSMADEQRQRALLAEDEVRALRGENDRLRKGIR